MARPHGPHGGPVRLSPPPAWLRGAWRRQGVVVDGTEVPEACTALWVQGPSWYADVRVPLAPAGFAGAGFAGAGLARAWAFAGTARWDPEPGEGGDAGPGGRRGDGPGAGELVWDHVLDSDGPGAGDRGRLSWAGEVLEERGVAVVGGVEVAYLERWERVAGPGGSLVEVSPGGVRAQAGPWRTEVRAGPGGRATGRLARREGGAWREVGVV